MPAWRGASMLHSGGSGSGRAGIRRHVCRRPRRSTSTAHSCRDSSNTQAGEQEPRLPQPCRARAVGACSTRPPYQSLQRGMQSVLAGRRRPPCVPPSPPLPPPPPPPHLSGCIAPPSADEPQRPASICWAGCSGWQQHTPPQLRSWALPPAGRLCILSTAAQRGRASNCSYCSG